MTAFGERGFRRNTSKSVRIIFGKGIDFWVWLWYNTIVVKGNEQRATVVLFQSSALAPKW